MALAISGVALMVAIAGTGVSWLAADSAADQAESAREQADVARNAFDKESSDQARKVNLNPDSFRDVLVLENTSVFPIRDIRVYMTEAGEPATQYASRKELAACKRLRLRVGDTDPAGLVVVFVDALGEQWITDAAGGLRKTEIGPEDVPQNRQYWEFDVRRATACS
jgi:hypothetical protein